MVEVAARQRTLAERYVNEVLLVRARRRRPTPPTTAQLLRQSADALLDGGTAPAVDGDDDETDARRDQDPAVRAPARPGAPAGRTT